MWSAARAGAGGAPERGPAHPAATLTSSTPTDRTGAQASIDPFDSSICRIDWQTVTCALCGAPPPVTACAYCGRDNDPGAQFCMDCGKPMRGGKSTGLKAATPAAGSAGAAPRTHVIEPPLAPPSLAPPGPATLACPFCGDHASGQLPFCPHCGRRLTAPGSGPTCARCGSPVPQGTKFCATCGTGEPQ